MTVNFLQVGVLKNESDHYRGLHLAIINPKSGNIEKALVFDTHISSDQLDRFINSAENISDGSIILAACKDDCVKNLSKTAKQWFIDMGSKEVLKLKYREPFVFIGVFDKSKKILMEPIEKRSESLEENISVTWVFVVGSGATGVLNLETADV